ncbi:aspartyl-phosphate phosphatase Spo0E family protein [Brevibacillus sp. HB1.3]|uniref:aspartyl-phosphate phosphatase Spo0E family protein n=1 Tax=Brevibacillus sp. HB1.3 TaxID=2738842 RepID=UPI00155667CD|nr:aspartyl-phosphate phosphatase Spo0E family protein [Brevibacillus sp. HB1.3]NQF15757.1 aspartyl-phosphate phosphatase Spo0E family protein [Brevibacillus sp. HB1.3]
MNEWHKVSNEDLLQIIVGLRQKLSQVIKKNGRLTDKTVVEVSQELDNYIVEWQRRKNINRKER